MRWRLCIAILPSLALILCGPSRLFPADLPRRIERIEIVRKQIFDTTRVEDRHLLGSLANGLHLLTREDVVRQELLFAEGDELDVSLLQESARNLRALGYLGDVTISSRDLGDTSAVVTVTTQDRWTIDALPAYRQEGGVSAQRYTVKDDNFLGGGQSLSLTYSYRTDRPTPHGAEVTFHDRNLFGTRLQTLIQHKSGWDQQNTGFGLERQFYSDRTRWAGGFYAEFGRQKQVYYENGRRTFLEEATRQMQKGWWSVAFGSQVLIRPAISYTRSRSNLADPSVNDNLDLVTVGLGVLHRSFVERTYLNSSGRTEDLPLGLSAGVTLGKNFLSAGLPASLYTAGITVAHAMQLSDRFYAGWRVSCKKFWGGSRQEEATLEALLLQHLKVSRFQTLVGQVQAIAGLGWSGRRQLLLGSSTGLRGYSEGRFSGDRMLTYGIEHRLFTELHILFFRLGGALFLDGGAVWSGDAPPGRQRFSNAAGFGLRIENTKLQGAGLIRIDWAMNLDERRPGQIILSSRLPFSAFLDLDGTASSISP